MSHTFEMINRRSIQTNNNIIPPVILTVKVLKYEQKYFFSPFL